MSNLLRTVPDFAMVGATPLTSNGGRDQFITKLRGSDGAVLWARSFGGAGQETGNSVAVDPAGNPVFVTTRWHAQENFGG